MPSASEKQALPALELLEQTPIIIEKILYSATQEQLHWKPAPDRWSISEVLAHLVEVERVFRERARRMVEENNPSLDSYDQNAAYAAGKYSSGTAAENLRDFCHERDCSVSWLRYLSPALVARTALHSELGPITLGHLIHEWAFHDLGHVRQISELFRARAFYPKMGGFQRYYTLKP
jgi:hypothetical protein